MKIRFAFAALSLIASVPAMAESHEFVRDGQTYRYDLTQKGEVTLIAGRNLSSGEKFTLRVRDNRVTGYYDGTRVAFDTSVLPSDMFAAR